MSTPRKESTRIAAYGLIVIDSKILLCRTSTQLKEYQGLWTLPGGGIEFGEAPSAALVREVKEETGLSIEAGDIAGIDSIVFDRPESSHHAIRILYFVKNISGELAYEIGGTTDMCAWFTFDDARKLPNMSQVEIGINLIEASLTGAAE